MTAPVRPHTETAQARVRHNDYSGLQPPRLGGWEPHLSVSVVVPAFQCQDKLDLTLASLAAQSYPAHLMEVIVVDDGSASPLRLPEIVPENTRLVTAPAGGWGSGWAFHTGALAAAGEVLLRLDADMLVFREHVEAHLRWHHLAGYLVVLGHKRFVDYSAGQLTPRETYRMVAGDAAGTLFDYETSHPHWVERVIDGSDGLRTAGHLAFRVYTGATGSLTSRLYHDAGGMDAGLVLGGDSEFGYRLGQAGAAFVPDNEATSWHLGLSGMMLQRDQGSRFRLPYVCNRTPLPRSRRGNAPRQWLVPYIDVVVDAREAVFEDVRATVDGVLAGTLPDVRVSLVGQWSALHDRRRAPLEDPLLDLRLLGETYAYDARVALVESVPRVAAPVPFRLVCPPGWVLVSTALDRLTRLAGGSEYGVVSLSLPGEPEGVARLERTAAVARAETVRTRDEHLDDVVDELFGIYWLDGTEWAFVPASERGDSGPAARAGGATDWAAEAERWKHEAQRWQQVAVHEQRRRLRARLRRRLPWLARAWVRIKNPLRGARRDTRS